MNGRDGLQQGTEHVVKPSADDYRGHNHSVSLCVPCPHHGGYSSWWARSIARLKGTGIKGAWHDMDISGSDLFVRALIFWLDQAHEKLQVGVMKGKMIKWSREMQSLTYRFLLSDACKILKTSLLHSLYTVFRCCAHTSEPAFINIVERRLLNQSCRGRGEVGCFILTSLNWCFFKRSSLHAPRRAHDWRDHGLHQWQALQSFGCTLLHLWDLTSP